MTTSAAPPTQSVPLFGRARFGAPVADAAPVLAIVVALVVLRALVYLLFEQVAFDSDQAINGLRAKHTESGARV